MTQVRFTQSTRTIGLQARVVSRGIASPRAALSFAASRVSSPAPTLTFASRLSTITMADAENSASKRPRASNNRRTEPAKKARSFHATPEVFSQTKFSSLEGKLDKRILSAIIDDMGYEYMTPVQAATGVLMPPERPDALVQARTGTGKTLAFLMPALQKCIMHGRNSGHVSTLIIAPTRELAMQIHTEAKALMKNIPMHHVEIVMGQTNKAKEERRILHKADILVATPGRLLDHMDNEHVMKQFKQVDTIILDEADRLLDMGFRNDLKKIIGKIPRDNSKIQGMLFSATIPAHVVHLADIVCQRGQYKHISTIPEGEVQTHERVQQDLITVPEFPSIAPALVGALQEEAARTDLGGPLKAIVFAPTAQQVDYYERILAATPGLPPVSALHARKSQSKRTKNTEEFRNAKGAILVATDVVARGMDFPNVTTVVQAGVPDVQENYIHRLGRTARAEAEGRGILIMASGEKNHFDKQLGKIDFTPRQANLAAADAVTKTSHEMTHEEVEKLYRSWIAQYWQLRKSLGWENNEVFSFANAFAKALGGTQTMTMTKKSTSMMGIKRDTPGLAIEKEAKGPKQGNRNPGNRTQGGRGQGGRPQNRNPRGDKPRAAAA